ncbi:SMC-Scp complex subunit ScpB [Candidatus Parcubacteria bacterium]|nr:MAG: SMC-Scp complex subunit ScpB [Candidatus Parcubacteria bacterium]
MNLSQKIEAILFVKGEPAGIKYLAEILGCQEEDVSSALGELENELKNRGVRLTRNGDMVSLGTAPELSEIVKEIVKSELDGELSKASLETLSVILYKGPVSRAEIDYIRGVNSSFILRNLLIRGLIEREEKRAEDKTFVYKPSFELLKFLGITSIEELPDFAAASAKLKEFLNKNREENK